jgi:DNA-binding XRE family transcriptional regulator
VEPVKELNPGRWIIFLTYRGCCWRVHLAILPLVELKGYPVSQEGLALEAEVDRTYVSQIERGVCNPSLLVLHKLAMVLQVSVVSLLKAGK